MSVKKQIHTLSKLFSIYVEVPESRLDGTHVEKWSYHIIRDISQSYHWTIRVSGGSNNRNFAIKFFLFCDLKTKQLYFLSEEISISRNETVVLQGILCNFLKNYEQASKST